MKKKVKALGRTSPTLLKKEWLLKWQYSFSLKLILGCGDRCKSQAIAV
ncbi:MAG: hypothetical protein QNJ18_04390 [Xenococcaceae cyanobacterium MO_167.B52]|nr:hypothetical protein [Xenococcaceae cyanobacterium MO_167.B52]